MVFSFGVNYINGIFYSIFTFFFFFYLDFKLSRTLL